MAALAAAAGGVRLAAAVLRPPWHDEYFTAWAAALPPRELLAALRLDSGPPLPYLLAKLVAALGVEPLAAARAVSLLAGTLAVLVAAAAARRAWGAEAGWWCGALLAVHPLAVAWSAEGRAYALLLLAAALAWERLQALADGRPAAAAGLALAVALGCWTHALGLVVAAAAAATVLLLGGRLRARGLAAVAAGLAAHLPWLPIALAQPAGASAWMGAAWAGMPPHERLLAPVRLLPPLAPFAAQLDVPSAPTWVALAGALGCALLLAAARGALPVALLAALPPVGLLAAALAGATFLVPGRSEAVYLGAFAGLLAAGATRAPWRQAVAALLVVGGAATTGLALTAWSAQPPRTEARLAGAIAGALPAGGTVVIGGYWRLGVAHHLRAAGARFDLVSVPTVSAAHPGWYDDGERPAAGELDALAARLAAGGGTVAVVVAPGLATAAPLALLARRLGLTPALATPEAVLWLPAPPPAS
jgi:mannosyltransferase